MSLILGIYGAGGIGREVLELARNIESVTHRWNKILFIDDGDIPPVVNTVEVIKVNDLFSSYSSNIEVAIAVGEPSTREKLWYKLREHNVPTATLVHPSVHVPESSILGQGVIIQVGSFISCNLRIGDNIYIQPYSNVGHDCVIGENTVISTGACLAGGLRIGRNVYIGMGAVLKEFISIGNDSIVGMASAVYKDIDENTVVMGNPARAVHRNDNKRVFGG